MASPAYYFLSTVAFVVIVIISKLILTSWLNHKRRRLGLRFPPSPPSLPIIGHLHLLKEPLHRTLQTLSQQYGPIYSLSMGVLNAVVVSSPSLAEECLNKNDVVFANRPYSIAGEILSYNYTTVGAAPYGPHWRNLRRLSSVELLSASRLNSSVHIRQDEVNLMVRDLFHQVSGGGSGFSEVEMRPRLSGLSMNVIMRLVAGKRYFGPGGGRQLGLSGGGGGERFGDVIREMLEAAESSNPGDVLPALRWLDLGGIEKNLRRIRSKCDAFFQGLIEDHRKNTEAGDDRKANMIGTMLSLQESDPETYSDEIIKGQILSMIVAGSDTTAATLEWAMAVLLNHPEILNKATMELDNVIGTERLIQESDLPKLPCLGNIINETLRLYPVGPLLLPHRASEDCVVDGYHIHKGTMLFVNAWAIHRDPDLWDDPMSFRPERHDHGVEAEEEAYRLLPFGMGRRSCPGSGLANRAVGLALGSLIQCFEWKKTSEALVDLSEGRGITMHKAEPLKVLCGIRECMRNTLKIV